MRKITLLLFLSAFMLGQLVTNAQGLFISQNCDPKDNYAADRFAEIYNPTTASIDLTGWTLENVQAGAVAFTWTLSGTIASDEALICGNVDATAQTITPDFTATWVGNTWNGKGIDGTILKNASGDVVDYAVQADATGTFENAEMVRNANVNTPTATFDASEWTFTAVTNAVDATPGTHTVDASAAELFFSEYIEGSGNSKAIEIFNATGADVDLSSYTIKQSHNGTDWGVDGIAYVLPLTGTLTIGDVYVISASDANEAILAASDLPVAYSSDQGGKVPFFTGNDALGLFKSDALIDVIGVPTESSKWAIAGITDATEEHTLVRKASITEGNTDWAASAGTTAEDSEWIVYELDNFSYIGSHNKAIESTETDILTFVLAEQSGAAVIDAENHTVAIEVVNGTVVTALEPTVTLSAGATVVPASGAAQDFTAAVVYTVTAENGVAEQAWTVTVTVVAELSHAADILTFVLDTEIEDAIINATDTTITSMVAWDTDITALTPSITASAGAEVTPVIAQDFSTAVVYTVTAQDGTTTKDWTVTVTKAAEPNHGVEILTFVLDELAGSVTIDSAAATIVGELMAGTDASELTPTITVSEGAQVTPTTVQDFTASVVYTVTAEDLTTTKDWTVTLTVKDPEMVSIYDIQFTEDESGDSPLFGQVVITAGVVTGFDDYGFYMQDSTKAWNGLYINVYDLGDAVNVGDSVEVQGLVNEYWGLTQLTKVDTVIVVNSDNTIPSAMDVTIPEVKEQYESTIVKATDLTCINTELYYEGWTAANGLDSIYIGTEIFTFSPALDQNFPSITGIVTFKRDYFRILPREAADIILGLEENRLQVISMYPNPVSNQLTVENLEGVSQVMVSNILGQSLFVQNVTAAKLTINTSDLETGVYIVTFVTENGLARSERIIKE